MYSAIAANKRKTIFLIFLFTLIIAAISTPFAWMYHNWWIIILATGFTLIYAGIQYFAAARAAISLAGAKEISKWDNPKLYNMVENLAITNGIPTPKVYIMNTSAPNAFATGRDPEHAHIAVTMGLLEILDDQELEGVLAHEMAHIKNYDIRVSMIVFALVGAIVLLAEIAYWVSLGKNNRSGGNPILLIIGILSIILAPLAATMISAAVSRQREYLADASGVMMTRYPEGLISALQKISGTPVDNQERKIKDKALESLYFVSPLRSEPKKFNSWLSTHPPIEQRIERLSENSTKF